MGRILGSKNKAKAGGENVEPVVSHEREDCVAFEKSIRFQEFKIPKRVLENCMLAITAGSVKDSSQTWAYLAKELGRPNDKSSAEYVQTVTYSPASRPKCELSEADWELFESKCLPGRVFPRYPCLANIKGDTRSFLCASIPGVHDFDIVNAHLVLLLHVLKSRLGEKDINTSELESYIADRKGYITKHNIARGKYDDAKIEIIQYLYDPDRVIVPPNPLSDEITKNINKLIEVDQEASELHDLSVKIGDAGGKDERGKKFTPKGSTMSKILNVYEREVIDELCDFIAKSSYIKVVSHCFDGVIVQNMFPDSEDSIEYSKMHKIVTEINDDKNALFPLRVKYGCKFAVKPWKFNRGCEEVKKYELDRFDWLDPDSPSSMSLGAHSTVIYGSKGELLKNVVPDIIKTVRMGENSTQIVIKTPAYGVIERLQYRNFSGNNSHKLKYTEGPKIAVTHVALIINEILSVLKRGRLIPFEPSGEREARTTAKEKAFITQAPPHCDMVRKHYGHKYPAFNPKKPYAGIPHIRNQLLYAVCDGNKEMFDMILEWFSRAHHAEKTGVMVVLTGPGGCGKTSQGKLVEAMFGTSCSLHAQGLNSLTSNFNGSLEGVVAAFLDEITCDGADRMSVTEKLKDMITGKVALVNKKGVEAFKVDQRLNLMVGSNSDNPIMASVVGIERRLFQLKMSHKSLKEHLSEDGASSHFKSFYAEIDSEGAAVAWSGLMEHIKDNTIYTDEGDFSKAMFAISKKLVSTTDAVEGGDRILNVLFKARAMCVVESEQENTTTRALTEASIVELAEAKETECEELIKVAEEKLSTYTKSLKPVNYKVKLVKLYLACEEVNPGWCKTKPKFSKHLVSWLECEDKGGRHPTLVPTRDPNSHHAALFDLEHILPSEGSALYENHLNETRG